MNFIVFYINSVDILKDERTASKLDFFFNQDQTITKVQAPSSFSILNEGQLILLAESSKKEKEYNLGEL